MKTLVFLLLLSQSSAFGAERPCTVASLAPTLVMSGCSTDMEKWCRMLCDPGRRRSVKAERR